MARYSYYLVILSVASALSGCVTEPELPRDIHIEDDFSVDQEEVLLSAIDSWNAVSLQCTGEEAINYVGLYNDPNGFDENDFGDSYNVIYLGDRDSEVYQDILEDVLGSYGEELYPVGYGTSADVILFPNPNDTLEDMRQVALHELGHFLGIQHNQMSPEFFEEELSSVMFHPNDTVGLLTKIDMEAFCIVHYCPYCPPCAFK